MVSVLACDLSDHTSIIFAGWTPRAMPIARAVAYFDESGKLADSQIVCFGGVVIPEGQIGGFTVAWERLLKSNGLPYTSMKDAMHFEGPYRDWKRYPEKRDALLSDLADLLYSSPIMRVSSPILTESFRELPHAFRAKLGNDPVYAGFESCVEGALQLPTEGDVQLNIHIFYDLAEEYSEKCVKLFHKLRKNKLHVKTHCVGISFVDDKVYAPVQAADMVAYCSRAYARRDAISLPPIIENISERLASQCRTEKTVLYRIEDGGISHGNIEPLE